MKLTYAITVCNEFIEIQNLLPVLLKNKRPEDQVVVLYDEGHGNKEIETFLRSESINSGFLWCKDTFNGDFAEWKNKLNSLCDGDYIFQIDADEMLTEYAIKIIPEIILTNPVDLIKVPRINTVDGLTDEHINKWGWRLNESGWVNYPDYQWRIYRNDSKIKWEGSVHEKITGYDTFSHLPTHISELSLIHHKTITKQEKQNNFYNDLLNGY